VRQPRVLLGQPHAQGVLDQGGRDLLADHDRELDQLRLVPGPGQGGPGLVADGLAREQRLHPGQDGGVGRVPAGVAGASDDPLDLIAAAASG